MRSAHFLFRLPQNHNPDLIMAKPSYKLQLWDVLQNTPLVLFKSVKVIRNGDVWEICATERNRKLLTTKWGVIFLKQKKGHQTKLGKYENVMKSGEKSRVTVGLLPVPSAAYSGKALTTKDNWVWGMMEISVLSPLFPENSTAILKWKKVLLKQKLASSRNASIVSQVGVSL